MKGKRGKKRITDLKQAMWVKLPRTGQVLQKLDKNGVVHIKGENPEFAGAPYYVYLGLGVHERGPIQYGALDLLKEGDYFYAEVRNSGVFDIHLKAQRIRNQKVMIVWWAIPLSSSCTIGPTLGPTPTPLPIGLTLGPTPTPPPIGPAITRFKQSDFPGRYVNEVPRIDADSIRRLTRARMKSLAALASADAAHIARILGISEVRAMGFIDEARRLLQGKTRK